MAAVRRSAGRDQRLMHVQGDRERAVDTGNVHRGLTVEHRPCPASGDRPLNLLLGTAQVREAINALGKLLHSPPRRPVSPDMLNDAPSL